MSSYYYLISSLPTLKADGDPPIDYEGFLALCKGNISPSAYSFLENLTLASDKGPLLKEWNAFYKTLTDELNYQRKLKLGRQAKMPETRDYEATNTVSAALAAKNPLESEQILLALQFKRLDELSGLHYFDDYVLNGYALKLKLLERKKCFKYEEGEAEFKSLFRNIQQQILKV